VTYPAFAVRDAGHLQTLIAQEEVAFATAIGECVDVVPMGNREELEFIDHGFANKLMGCGALRMSTIYSRYSSCYIVPIANALIRGDVTAAQTAPYFPFQWSANILATV
jgi:hypothetical protein